MCQWSGWSAWTACAEPCSGGVRQRYRQPLASPAGPQCRSQETQTQGCNTALCPGTCELKKRTKPTGNISGVVHKFSSKDNISYTICWYICEWRWLQKPLKVKAVGRFGTRSENVFLEGFEAEPDRDDHVVCVSVVCQKHICVFSLWTNAKSLVFLFSSWRNFCTFLERSERKSDVQVKRI